MLEAKTCSRCRQSKAHSEFSKRKRSSDGLDYYCRSCKSARYAVVAERECERRRENYAANVDSERAACRQWREANPEAMRQACRNWRARNPEKQAAASGNWNRNNRDKRAAAQNKRYTAQMQRTPKWLTPSDFESIGFFYTLSEAMTRATGVPHSVDHIYPLQGKTVSGLHVPSNLRVIPKRDNARKGNRYE